MHINFIEHKKFKLDLKSLKKDFQFNNLIMVIIVCVSLFLIVGTGMFQKLRFRSLTNKKQYAEQEIRSLQQRLSEQGVASSLVGKSTLLDRYERRIEWSEVLEKIAVNVPAGLWIHVIKSGDATKNNVNIVGESPDQGSVATFMETLRNIGVFRQVKLISSEIDVKSKGKNINFSIEVGLK